MSLLRYVPYIFQEKAKVKIFVHSLPAFMKEMLEFYNLKTMDEVIRKTRLFYQQMKLKGESNNNWTNKKEHKSLLNKNMKVAGVKSTFQK